MGLNLTVCWIIFIVILITIMALTYFDVITSNVGISISAIHLMIGMVYLAQRHQENNLSIKPDNNDGSNVVANFYADDSMDDLDGIGDYTGHTINGNGWKEDKFFKKGGDINIKNIKTPDLVNLEDHDLLYMLTKINREYDNLYTSHFNGSLEDPLDIKLKAFSSYQSIVNDHKNAINKKLNLLKENFEKKSKPLIEDIEKERKELENIKNLTKKINPELLKLAVNNSIPLDQSMSPEKINEISDANAILYKIAVSKAIIRDINKKYEDYSLVSLLFDPSKEYKLYEIKDKYEAEKLKLTKELNKYI